MKSKRHAADGATRRCRATGTRSTVELERLDGRRVGELEARLQAQVPLGSELAPGTDPQARRFTVARGGRVAVNGRFAFTAAGAI